MFIEMIIDAELPAQWARISPNLKENLFFGKRNAYELNFTRFFRFDEILEV